MKRVVITGASGLLGRALLREFGVQDRWDVRGTALRRTDGGLDRLDLCDTGRVREYLSDVRPDILIHSAAQRRPDISEKDPQGTRRLNVDATRELAALASGLGAWMVFISTDYVFDGTSPPYTPDRERNPLNRYGRSKCDGEDAVRALCGDHAILRVPILYGEVESLQESAVTTIADSLLKAGGSPVLLDDWATRYPTHVDDVAVVCRQMVEHRLQQPGFSGTFHWSGDEPMTKYDMGRVMAAVIELADDNLVPDRDPGPGAPRPHNCCLNTDVLEELGIGQRTAFKPGIERVLRPWQVLSKVV